MTKAKIDGLKSIIARGKAAPMLSKIAYSEQGFDWIAEILERQQGEIESLQKQIEAQNVKTF